MSLHFASDRAEELRRELLALLSAEPGATQRMTYEEFLEWADEDTLAEWVDGKVIMTSPASVRHQEVINFLVEVMSGFVRVRKLGRILDGPFQMKLASSGREPDVLYVTNAHVDRLHETYLHGPADLVVEVISPESAGRDRGDKFYEYQDAGIPEYWLIDPAREVAEFYQLDAQGHYRSVAPNEKGIYSSRALPGFWIDVGWLWQELLPDPVRVLLEVAGKEHAQYLRDELNRMGL